jgi:hypothetical protein
MTKTAVKGRTLADFRNAHDKDVVIPNKIQAALRQMSNEGPEHYLYEQELLEKAGVSTTDLAKYRDQFTAHIVVVNNVNGKALASPKNIWFHDPKVVKKLSGE